jgi:carotenoid cleavage dioxygenase-like enzyme
MHGMQVCDASLRHLTSSQEGALPFRTDKSKQCRIGLIKRAAPEDGVQWFDVNSFLVVHAAHAWEDGDSVHVVTGRCVRCSATEVRSLGNAALAECEFPSSL